MKQASGFTLLEVMLATAIMSIGIVSALELFGGSMRLAGSSARQTEALVLARSLVDEALWRGGLSEDLTRGKEGDYSWALEVRAIDRQLIGFTDTDEFGFEDDGDYELREIRATVTWGRTGGEKSVELVTARLAEVSE